MPPAIALSEDILINVTPFETRVALVEQGSVQELHVERSIQRGHVGNIYLGRVVRVLPGMQAAFVDIGLEKAAFLYVGDYFESTLETGETAGEPSDARRKGGRGRGRAAPPKIDTVLQLQVRESKLIFVPHCLAVVCDLQHSFIVDA